MHPLVAVPPGSWSNPFRTKHPRVLVHSVPAVDPLHPKGDVLAILATDSLRSGEIQTPAQKDSVEQCSASTDMGLSHQTTPSGDTKTSAAMRMHDGLLSDLRSPNCGLPKCLLLWCNYLLYWDSQKRKTIGYPDLWVPRLFKVGPQTANGFGCPFVFSLNHKNWGYHKKDTPILRNLLSSWVANPSPPKLPALSLG